SQFLPVSICGVIGPRVVRRSFTLVVAVPFAALVDHRPLRSFPTRRSSDLPPPHVRQQRRPPESDDDGDRRHGDFEQRPRSPSSSDRKSTRLNSSHVSISYAVFCLKKQVRHYQPSSQAGY